MLTFVLKRLAQVGLVILLVSLVCFTLMHVIPGGPVGMLAQNPKVSPEDLAKIRQDFGLDQPTVVQYASWLRRIAFHGDFGRSLTTGEPVLAMIGQRLPATLELMGSAFLIALLGGLCLGVASALRPRTNLESFLTMVSLLLVSIPVFWLGLLAIMVFSVELGLVPASGMYTLGRPFSLLDHLRHLVMPTLVLSSVLMAGWGRYLKASLDDALASDYVTVARAKGLSDIAVITRHALRNSLGPVLAVIAMHLPLLFAGSVIVETLFSWPGLGRLFYDGLLRMDYTRLMGIVFVSSLLTTFFNLLGDICHGALDPRVGCSH